MSDYTVKKIGEMDAIYRGAFKRARAELGVESFGMQFIDLPANIGDAYPEHDHSHDGPEEVYVVMSGSGELEVEGETIRLEPETVVRVGPTAKRRIRTGAEPMRLLALGAVPGRAYEAPDLSKLGAPEPS